MGERRKLPVVVPPGTRFTCHGCTACCRTFGVSVTEAERAALFARAAELAPHVPAPVAAWFIAPHGGADAPPEWTLAHDPGGACIFLEPETGLCRIHKHLGYEWKPETCRTFPLVVTERPTDVIVTARFQCETMWRSRRTGEGEPLETQTAWIRSTVAALSRVTVGERVHVLGGTFVPYALARALEDRALAMLRGAPTVETAMLAGRDLVFAFARALVPPEDDPAARARRVLGEPPDEAALARAARIVEAPLADLRAARGPIVPHRALEALGPLLFLFLQAGPRIFAARHFSGESDAFFLATVRTLYAQLARRWKWPEHELAGAAEADEGQRALAVDPAASDPAVLDFVRDCHVQVVSASWPFLWKEGLVFGYAHLALVHVLGRWGARLLAARRGAAAATPADWNTALAWVERSLTAFDMSGAAQAVVDVYRDLFFAEDLPA